MQHRNVGRLSRRQFGSPLPHGRQQAIHRTHTPQLPFLAAPNELLTSSHFYREVLSINQWLMILMKNG